MLEATKSYSIVGLAEATAERETAAARNDGPAERRADEE